MGLYLLSLMDARTSFWIESLFLLVLGAGIGLIMQILTLVVQNTAAYSDLGTATSGVTFFRTLGGSFGASTMGSIYSNGLKERLATALASARVSASSVSSPDLVKKLPAHARDLVITAYAQSLQHVFLFAVPLALVAAWGLMGVYIREQALGESARETAMIEAAIGRITLRLIRESAAESARAPRPAGR